MNKEYNVSATHTLPPSIAWSTIFAGSLLSIVIYLLLSLLGTAIGASSIDPAGQSNPLQDLGAHAGIWTAVSILLAIFIGAVAAGRTAPGQGALHGLLSWSITTLAAVWLLGSIASSLTGTAVQVLGKGISLAGEGVGASIPALLKSGKNSLGAHDLHVDWSDLQDQLDSLLKDTGKSQLDPDKLANKRDAAAKDLKHSSQHAAEHPQEAADDLKAWFQRVKHENQPQLNAADKQALVELIAKRTGKSPDEVRAIADRYAKTYEQAMADYQSLKQRVLEQARYSSQVAVKTVAKTAWSSLAILMISSLLSLLGGHLGWRMRRRHDAVSH